MPSSAAGRAGPPKLSPGPFWPPPGAICAGTGCRGGCRRGSCNASTGLDPQLDFADPGNPFYVAAIRRDLETYYDRFIVHPRRAGLRLLRAWQRVIRFGATALFVTTLLTLIGLVHGSRRARVGVLLLGLGGLSLILAPALIGTYAGRYTVPMADPLMAAAAIALNEIWRGFASRRSAAAAATGPLSPPLPSPPAPA